MPTIARVEQQVGVTLEQVIGDGDYGSGENRAACAEREVDLLAPTMQPPDPVVDKSAFQIDLAQQTATCPQGHTVSGKPGPCQHGQPTLQFTFARTPCAACPLFQRCVRSKLAGQAVVNLKCLFRLCDLGNQDLRALLAAHPAPQRRLAAA